MNVHTSIGLQNRSSGVARLEASNEPASAAPTIEDLLNEECATRCGCFDLQITRTPHGFFVSAFDRNGRMRASHPKETLGEALLDWMHYADVPRPQRKSRCTVTAPQAYC